VTARHDDEDPQLASLRAVWLAMPDEDPPTRGLDALMAAARAKAEVLATPPWWKRLLHALSRPPVLALASIMILIGGAVLISNRPDVREASPTVKSAPAKERGAGSPAVAPVEKAPAPALVPAPPAADPHAGAMDQHGQPAELPAELGARPATLDEAPAAAPAHQHVHHHAPPTHATHQATHQATTTDSPARPRDDRAVKGSVAPAFEPEPPPSAGAMPGGGGGAGDSAPTETRAPAPRAPQRVMVDQLLVQCRSAATRGDCEAAKLIARRIAGQDATFYREHVAPDAAIQKCLAAP
jgi:hypothetical protein